MTLPSKLIMAIASGKAILFTGAGFSVGCKNIHGKKLPNAKELASDIGKLGGFDAENQLQYAAEVYLKNNNKEDLVSYLRDKFTLLETPKYLDRIINLPWLRCYTTNYDESIEVAGLKNKKKYVTIDVEDSPKDNTLKNIVVHINGSISKLNSEKLNTSFKLSKSSYLTDEGFKKSLWYDNFIKDIDRCSALVFVGYSLYDFEIEKLISQNNNIDIYFITRKIETKSEKFRLEEYGTVLEIEAEGFSKQLKGILFDEKEKKLTSLQKAEKSITTSSTPKDRDLENLFIYGTISNELAINSTLGIEKNNYCINRYEYKDVLISFKNHIIITGELGSGKTLLLKQLSFILTEEGYNVYTVIDKYADFPTDLNLISQEKGTSIILLDNYEEYIDIIKHISINYNQEKILIIGTSRPSSHAKNHESIKNIFEYINFPIERFTKQDAINISNIIDTLGAWKFIDAAANKNTKTNFILDKTPTFSQLLLKLFESETIKERIKKDLDNIIKNSDIKSTIFAISLLSLAGVKGKLSLISKIAQNDLIRSSHIKSNQNFNDLFKIEKYGEVNISPIFAKFFINTQFTASEIKEKFLKIAKDLGAIHDRDKEIDKMFKHVLRFSSLETALPKNNKISTFNEYYEELKTIIPWLKNDPHYWLQYAMSKIAIADYKKAQQYLTNAYSFSRTKKFKYDTSDIDTQQARLYLKIYQEEDTEKSNDNFNLFIKADKLLKRLDDDIYKYKQLNHYVKIIQTHYGYLSPENKEYLVKACKYIEKRDKFHESSMSNTTTMHYIKDRIVNAIEESSKKESYDI